MPGLYGLINTYTPQQSSCEFCNSSIVQAKNKCHDFRHVSKIKHMRTTRVSESSMRIRCEIGEFTQIVFHMLWALKMSQKDMSHVKNKTEINANQI